MCTVLTRFETCNKYQVLVVVVVVTETTDGGCLCLVLTSFETCNKYQVKNSLGQQVYFAGEGQSVSQLLHGLDHVTFCDIDIVIV